MFTQGKLHCLGFRTTVGHSPLLLLFLLLVLYSRNHLLSASFTVLFPPSATSIRSEKLFQYVFSGLWRLLFRDSESWVSSTHYVIYISQFLCSLMNLNILTFAVRSDGAPSSPSATNFQAKETVFLYIYFYMLILSCELHFSSSRDMFIFSTNQLYFTCFIHTILACPDNKITTIMLTMSRKYRMPFY